MGDPNPSYPRCRLCSGPLSNDTEASNWTVAPLIRDSFSMIGTAVGGTASAFYGFNHAMPIVRRWVKGPIWLHFFIGAPPVIVFSSACAGLAGGNRTVQAGLYIPLKMFEAACIVPRSEEHVLRCTGGALPALAQLISSSYHAAMSSSTLAHPSSQEDNMHKRSSSSPL